MQVVDTKWLWLLRLDSNQQLTADRGIGFEEIVFLIGQGHVLEILEHPNQERYGGQRIFVVQRDDYLSRTSGPPLKLTRDSSVHVMI